MVDRPKRPEPGTPEYNWLYGESGDDAAGEPDRGSGRQPSKESDDRTRILPIVRPHREPPAPGTPPSTQRPASVKPVPPPGEPSRRFPRFPRFGRFRWRWLILLPLLWIVWLVAVPLWAFQQISTVDAFPDGNRPDDQDGTTYLIVGSDKADDLSDEQRKELHTGPRSHSLTDTIMVLHVGSGPNLLMSIPRDSWVDMPGYGTSKINSAFGRGGPKLLVHTVEKNTGIRIDDYIELGFGSVINVVDAVGGVEICPKQKMVDKKAHLDIDKGCQDVDGMTALAYSRSRHATKFSDLGRVGQQREVVSAIGDEVASPWTVVNPFRYWHVMTAAADSVRVSDGTGPIDLARFGWAMTHLGGDDGMTCTVPVANFNVDWDPERSHRLFRYIINDDTDSIPKALCTRTGLPR